MIRHPSPNHGPRRGGALPDMVVLHYTAMPDCDEALHRLCDPQAEVSAHYLIARDGTVLNLVDEDRRAWHAGAGRWGAVTDVNSRSVGIELDNSGRHPFPDPQMQALERLLDAVMTRWSVPPERVIGHSDMAPTRKWDPGRRFDWRRLARTGLSVWPDATEAARKADEASAPGGSAAFDTAATAFGYDPDLPHDVRLDAFRQRFRPWADGPVTPADLAAVRDLAARFPVDRGAGNA